MNNEDKLIESGWFKEKAQRRFAVRDISDLIVEEGELLLRIPNMMNQIIYLLDKIEGASEVLKYIYPKTKRENPVRACLMVGGLSRTRIGHIDSYDSIRQNMDNMSRYDFSKKQREIARRNADFDGFLITKNITEPPRGIAKKLVRLLPKVELEDFQGYECHEDCVGTERDFIRLLELYNTEEDYSMGVHQFEILEKNDQKEKIPVIVWESNKLDSKIKEEFDTYVESGWLRRKVNYVERTWKAYEEAFKERFPEDYNRIIQASNNEFRKFRAMKWPEYLNEITAPRL